MKPEAKAVFSLLPKLPAAAKLAQQFDDVLVGPQKDGQFPPTHSGVKVSSLPASTRRYVTDLIAAYVNDVPSAIAPPRGLSTGASTRTPTWRFPAEEPTPPARTSVSTGRRRGLSSLSRAL